MKYLNKNIVIVSENDKGTLVHETITGKSYRLGDDELQILAYMCEGKDTDYICNIFGKYNNKNIKKLMGFYNSIFFDVNSLHFASNKKYCFPKALVDFINKKFFKIYAYVALFVSIPIFLISIFQTILIGHYFSVIEIKISIADVFFNIVVLSASLLFCFFLHEISHAAVASYFGCEVIDMGIKRCNHGLEGFANILGFERLDIRKKIFIMLAGIFANMRITGYGLLAGNIIGGNLSWCFYLLAFVSIINIIVNLLPIKNFDGKIIYNILKERRNNTRGK